MSHTTDRWREFDLLMDRLLDGLQSEADTRRLNELLRSDPAACRRYVGYVEVHGRLSLGEGNAKAHGGTSNDASGGTGLACGTQALGGTGLASGTQALGGTGLASGTQARETPGDGSEPHRSSFVAHPFVSWRPGLRLCGGVADFGGQCADRSDMGRVRSPRGRPQRPAADTEPRPADTRSRRPRSRRGRGTDYGDGRLPLGRPGDRDGEPRDVRRGPQVRAGLRVAENQLPRGAIVILEGPARYEVDSVAGGVLSFGKLTVN